MKVTYEMEKIRGREGKEGQLVVLNKLSRIDI